MLSLRSTSRKVVPSCSDSGIMPYDQGLSTAVVIGRQIVKKFQRLTGELNSNGVGEAFYVWEL